MKHIYIRIITLKNTKVQFYGIFTLIHEQKITGGKTIEFQQFHKIKFHNHYYFTYERSSDLCIVERIPQV